jgi:hypothetical protein
MINCGSLLRQILTTIVFTMGTAVAIANEPLPKDRHGRHYFEFAGHKIALTTLEAGNKDVQITLRFSDTQSVGRFYQRHFGRVVRGRFWTAGVNRAFDPAKDRPFWSSTQCLVGSRYAIAAFSRQISRFRL